MLTRITVWHDHNDDPVQVSLALLDGYWELLYETTLPVGPFHPLDEQVAQLRAELRQYLRSVGIQTELQL